jgi:hypothetical protein
VKPPACSASGEDESSWFTRSLTIQQSVRITSYFPDSQHLVVIGSDRHGGDIRVGGSLDHCCVPQGREEWLILNMKRMLVQTREQKGLGEEDSLLYGQNRWFSGKTPSPVCTEWNTGYYTYIRMVSCPIGTHTALFACL